VNPENPVTGYFERDPETEAIIAGWFVDGEWHSNSAAKFWAGIHESQWNGHTIEANFNTDSPDHTARRSVAFSLSSTPLHEGLYRCCVVLRPFHLNA
jgi:hypothetical protein